MKIFMATLATETNTFSPLPTGRAGFMGERDWFRNDGSRHAPTLGNIPLIAWRRLGEGNGHTVSESICAFAQPAGTTLRVVYEELRDMLLADLRAAMPVDVVLLFMHGAMVADGYDDCEGDTLARVRSIVGPGAKIGIELDLHCHLTEAMRTNATAIVIFKEYPHTDIAERAADLYGLCVRAAAGEIRPVIAYYDCRMVNMWRTPVEPVRSFIDRMTALEGKDGILSVSFGHGFPWGDVEDVGAKMLAIADGDASKAEALARRLGGELWAMREAAAARHDTIDGGSTPRSQPSMAGARSSWPMSRTTPAAARPRTTRQSCTASSSAASPASPPDATGTRRRSGSASRRARAQRSPCGSAANAGRPRAIRWICA